MPTLRRSCLLATAMLGIGAAPALALPDGWSAPTALSSARVSGLQPWAAANTRGDLVVAWRARTGGRETVQVARRPAGASGFASPITIGPRTGSAQGVRAAVGPTGRILVGWRTRKGGRSTVRAAFISASGTAIRVASFRGALDASGPVNVAITPTGLAAVGWVAREPGSTGSQTFFGGRAQIAIARPGRPFGPARALNPASPRRFACAAETGTDLAARSGGGILAWWDCNDGTRDFETTTAQISTAGVVGHPQTAGGLSRGPSWSAFLPIGVVAAMGVQSVNNDDDEGPNVVAMARSATGTWTLAPVTVTGATPGLSPHILGRAHVAGASGAALSAWVGDDDEIVAMTGSNMSIAWDPATALPTTGDLPIVAGVGVTTTRSLQVVFSTRPAPGPARTLWSSRRLATDAAFSPPEDALHISRLTGAPAFALGRGGRGVVVYSEGPTSAARVRAAMVEVP